MRYFQITITAFFTGLLKEYHEHLSPNSGSGALRQVNHTNQKAPYLFFCFKTNLNDENAIYNKILNVSSLNLYFVRFSSKKA